MYVSITFLNQINQKLRGLEQIQEPFHYFESAILSNGAGVSETPCTPTSWDPNKNSCMVRNVYRALRNQVLKVRGTESWTRSLPPTYKIRWGEHCIVPQGLPLAHTLQAQTNTEGTVHDPLDESHSLASPGADNKKHISIKVLR